MGDTATLLRYRRLLGRTVKVTVHYDPLHVVRGRLLSVAADGEVAVLCADDLVRYVWPALAMEPIDGLPETVRARGRRVS